MQCQSRAGAAESQVTGRPSGGTVSSARSVDENGAIWAPIGEVPPQRLGRYLQRVICTSNQLSISQVSGDDLADGGRLRRFRGPVPCYELRKEALRFAAIRCPCWNALRLAFFPPLNVITVAALHELVLTGPVEAGGTCAGRGGSFLANWQGNYSFRNEKT